MPEAPGPARRSQRAAVLLAVLVAAAPAVPAVAGPPPAPRGQDAGAVLVVLDASGSMLRPDTQGRTRIVSAKEAIGTVVGQLPRATPVGLRVFGSQSTAGRTRASCTDSRLVVPVSTGSASLVAGRVAGVQARGWTPMGWALQRAEQDLVRSADAFGTVVLVSDGIDECYPELGPEPCEVARSFGRGAVRLQVHTVGFTVDPAARQQLQCIARVTGGRYSDAGDTRSLIDALRRGLLPPYRPRAGPPAPPAPRILATVGGVLALGAVGATAVAVVRALHRRRRRSYW